jgi:hypothetical protein
MEREKYKDWTDAIREKYLSEAEVPVTIEWKTIERRMHRSVVLRRSAFAAVFLIPLTALLLWSPWKNNTESLPEFTASITEESSVIPADEAAEVDINKEKTTNNISNKLLPNIKLIQVETITQMDQETLEEQDEPEVTSPQPFVSKELTGEKHPSQPTKRQVREIVPEDYLAFAELEQKKRKKVSVGLSLGTGAIQREMELNMLTESYVVKLAYMNIIDPAKAQEDKINTVNIDDYWIKYLHAAAPGPNTQPVSSPSGIGYVHDLPLTFGILTRFNLIPWLSVESGLEYTYLHSVADNVIAPLDLRLHFIGVPLMMETLLWSNNNWELYAGVGGKVEKCVYASFGQIECEEPRLQWSAQTAAGLQYRILNHTNLYIQPELSWYFTQTDLITYRTEHPFSLAINAGLRFDL